MTLKLCWTKDGNSYYRRYPKRKRDSYGHEVKHYRRHKNCTCPVPCQARFFCEAWGARREQEHALLQRSGRRAHQVVRHLLAPHPCAREGLQAEGLSGHIGKDRYVKEALLIIGLLIIGGAIFGSAMTMAAYHAQHKMECR